MAYVLKGAEEEVSDRIEDVEEGAKTPSIIAEAMSKSLPESRATSVGSGRESTKDSGRSSGGSVGAPSPPADSAAEIQPDTEDAAGAEQQGCPGNGHHGDEQVPVDRPTDDAVVDVEDRSNDDAGRDGADAGGEDLVSDSVNEPVI